jgi:hypothetical protein
MGIRERMPLINSSNKSLRMAGYILYAGVILIDLGTLLLSSAPAR